jgi:recombinational DNA repair protein (RecF pathway)
MDAALLQDGRTHARGDLERIALMAYATEVCGQLSREEHPEPKLYGLLDMAITLIDALIEPASQLFRLGLEAKALTFAGIAPRFTTCMTCDLEAEGKMLLTTSGVHHYACSRDGEQVSTQWLLAVEGARRSPLRESIDAPDPSGPQWILAELLEQHLGRRLRSRSILATLTL